MAEKDPNLEGSINIDDLSGIDFSDLNGDGGTGGEGTGTDNETSSSNIVSSVPDIDIGKLQLDGATNVLTKNVKGTDNGTSSSTIDENLFLDGGDNSQKKTRSADEVDQFGVYLTWFYSSSFFIIISIVVIALFFSFSSYLSKITQVTLNDKEQRYVDSYKGKFETVKGRIGINNKSNYSTPPANTDEMMRVNNVVLADDIDYMDKKDILSPYISNMVRDIQNSISKIDSINKDVAMQGFLPEEIEGILEEEQAIDTIQRSLNALEVIKFSTAMKVFSYLDSAIQTISEMIRISDSSPDDISQILNQVTTRGEKDISSYIYMCYLNPFETNANCDTIGDLDLYYDNIIKDKTINLSLFKNVMSAINQLLEKEDTSLFSITFNGFNAQDENITFNIEVYTNQNDERSLMLQGKKNPNIFILTNIINLLKQSSFIIGAEINTKEVNVETRDLDLGGFTNTVNYSSKDFTVPIQKDMEREIFDYIDLDAIIKMLKKMDVNIDDSSWSEDLDSLGDSPEESKDAESEDNTDEDNVQQESKSDENEEGIIDSEDTIEEED